MKRLTTIAAVGAALTLGGCFGPPNPYAASVLQNYNAQVQSNRVDTSLYNYQPQPIGGNSNTYAVRPGMAPGTYTVQRY